jgi:hypothetical protein
MICGEHRTYNPKCNVCVRADKIASAYSHAAVGVQDAAGVIGKGWPHNAADRAKLAKAAESLNAYLAELER